VQRLYRDRVSNYVFIYSSSDSSNIISSSSSYSYNSGSNSSYIIIDNFRLYKISKYIKRITYIKKGYTKKEKV